MMEAQARVRICEGCGVTLQDRDVYSVNEKTFCHDCYLGAEQLGPYGDQYVECPHCGTILHKYTIVCFNCHNAIREVGKIQAESKNVGMRILIYIIALFVLVVLAVALGPMGIARGGSTARAVVLGILGPLLAALGGFRVSFPNLFIRRRYLGSLWGGIVGWILVSLGLLFVALLPFG